MAKDKTDIRIQPSLRAELAKVAKSEGISISQLVNVAIAEKLATARTASYFRERASRADVGKAMAILECAGRGNVPARGDELPRRRQPRSAAAGAARSRRRDTR